MVLVENSNPNLFGPEGGVSFATTALTSRKRLDESLDQLELIASADPQLQPVKDVVVSLSSGNDTIASMKKAEELSGCDKFWGGIGGVFITIGDAFMAVFIWIACLFGYQPDAKQDDAKVETDDLKPLLAPDSDIPLVDTPAPGSVAPVIVGYVQGQTDGVFQKETPIYNLEDFDAHCNAFFDSLYGDVSPNLKNILQQPVFTEPARKKQKLEVIPAKPQELDSDAPLDLHDLDIDTSKTSGKVESDIASGDQSTTPATTPGAVLSELGSSKPVDNVEVAPIVAVPVEVDDGQSTATGEQPTAPEASLEPSTQSVPDSQSTTDSVVVAPEPSTVEVDAQSVASDDQPTTPGATQSVPDSQSATGSVAAASELPAVEVAAVDDELPTVPEASLESSTQSVPDSQSTTDSVVVSPEPSTVEVDAQSVASDDRPTIPGATQSVPDSQSATGSVVVAPALGLSTDEQILVQTAVHDELPGVPATSPNLAPLSTTGSNTHTSGAVVALPLELSARVEEVKGQRESHNAPPAIPVINSEIASIRASESSKPTHIVAPASDVGLPLDVAKQTIIIASPKQSVPTPSVSEEYTRIATSVTPLTTYVNALAIVPSHTTQPPQRQQEMSFFLLEDALQEFTDGLMLHLTRQSRQSQMPSRGSLTLLGAATSHQEIELVNNGGMSLAASSAGQITGNELLPVSASIRLPGQNTPVNVVGEIGLVILQNLHGDLQVRLVARGTANFQGKSYPLLLNRMLFNGTAREFNSSRFPQLITSSQPLAITNADIVATSSVVGVGSPPPEDLSVESIPVPPTIHEIALSRSSAGRSHVRGILQAINTVQVILGGRPRPLASSTPRPRRSSIPPILEEERIVATLNAVGLSSLQGRSDVSLVKDSSGHVTDAQTVATLTVVEPTSLEGRSNALLVKDSSGHVTDAQTIATLTAIEPTLLQGRSDVSLVKGAKRSVPDAQTVATLNAIEPTSLQGRSDVSLVKGTKRSVLDVQTIATLNTIEPTSLQGRSDVSLVKGAKRSVPDAQTVATLNAIEPTSWQGRSDVLLVKGAKRSVLDVQTIATLNAIEPTSLKGRSVVPLLTQPKAQITDKPFLPALDPEEVSGLGSLGLPISQPAQISWISNSSTPIPRFGEIPPGFLTRQDEHPDSVCELQICLGDVSSLNSPIVAGTMDPELLSSVLSGSFAMVEPNSEGHRIDYQTQTDVDEDVFTHWQRWEDRVKVGSPRLVSKPAPLTDNDNDIGFLDEYMDSTLTSLPSSTSANGEFQRPEVQSVYSSMGTSADLLKSFEILGTQSKDDDNELGEADESRIIRQSIQMCAVRKAVNYHGQPNLLACLHNTFQNDDYRQWTDETRLAIVDGSMVVLADGQDVAPQFSVFMSLASNTYGLHLTGTLMARYQWQNKQDLTWGDVKALFVGVGANVKTFQLKNLFEQIKFGYPTKDNYMHCGEYLSPSEQEGIRSVDTFEELSPRQIKQLVDVFRTVPIRGKRIPMMEAFHPTLVPNNDRSYFDPILHDQTTLYKFEGIKVLNVKEPRLALAEYVSKKLIYQELKEGMIIPMLDKQGELTYCEVSSSLEHKGDAVITVILTPLHKQEVTEDNPLEVHLIFRGTQFQTGQIDAVASVVTDLDPRGVGHKAFRRRKQEILNLVSGALRSDELQYAKINIHGHSLGGAWVMRAVEATTEQFVQQTKMLDEVNGVLDNLTPKFADARDVLENLSSSDNPDQQKAALSTIFEEGGSFDQLKQFVNTQKSKGSLDPIFDLPLLERLVREGDAFKRLWSQYVTDSKETIYQALIAQKTQIERTFEEVIPKLQEVKTVAESYCKMRGIDAVTWNAPLVEIGVNNQFKEHIRYLEEIHSHLIIDLIHGRFNADWIQKLGGGVLLGFGIVSNLLRKKVIFHYNEAVAGIAAHCAIAYTTEETRQLYRREIIDENSPGDALEKLLGADWYWGEDSSTIGWYAGYLGRWALVIPHVGVYGALKTIDSVAWLTGRYRDKSHHTMQT